MRAARQVADKTVFAALKKGAYVINVARGPIVNQRDLVDGSCNELPSPTTSALYTHQPSLTLPALNSSHISGFALDVFDTEPLPANSKLWTDVRDRSRVFMTPHMTWSSTESTRRILEMWKGNLERFVQGRELVNLVDVKHAMKS